MTQSLILASKSQYRAQLMANAGLQFETKTAAIDERAIEASLEDANLDGADLAMLLAMAKAQDVSATAPSALVVGSDQTLTLDGVQFHKPTDMEEARRHLLRLSGKTHQLNSAIVLCKDGEIIWQHNSVANMKVRELTPQFIGQHLSDVGDKALTSVGAYQIEGRGIQIFEEIQGDTFTIMGLPLLPLLAQLRILGVINA